MTDINSWVGKRAVFLGNESPRFNTTALVQIAQMARKEGYDTLVVKRADGQNRWYRSVADLIAEKKAVNGVGCGLISYTYSYGPRFNITASECVILKEIIQAQTYAIADMEVEYNGRPAAVQDFINHMAGDISHTLVTTWGDPAYQSWNANVQLLDGKIAAWLPQVYSDFLLQTYIQEWRGHVKTPLQPIYSKDARDVAHNLTEHTVYTWEGV